MKDPLPAYKVISFMTCISMHKIGIIMDSNANDSTSTEHAYAIKNAIKELDIDENQLMWKYSVKADENCYEAAKVFVNEFRGGGNSLNNLKQVFPDHLFVENYFPGDNPEHGGMDWQVLRVVIETKEGKHYVIALINDRWTI